MQKVLLAAAWSIACGENLTTLTADASIAIGSGNTTSLGRSDDDNEDAGTSSSPPPPLSCSTDLDCDSSDLCRRGSRCVFGTCLVLQPRCVDNNPCSEDRCDPETGECSFPIAEDGADCADDNRCDGQICVDGRCTSGSPRACFEDGNPCTVESCSASTGECISSTLAAGTPCSDGDPCNGFETCVDGSCRSGTPLACDDGNPCTLDGCNAFSNGCLSVPVPDGSECGDKNACNGAELCAAGKCVANAVPVVCFDDNPCTVDTCQPETGSCIFNALPNAMPCPDGDLCDGQICRNGACVPGVPVTCTGDNDGNACSENACNPATGLCIPRTLPDGASCPDGNPCDGTETCRAGHCTERGSPLVCEDDANPCTRDVCDPAWGCVHASVPDGTSCADSNACNGAEVCRAGSCSAGAALRCDDFNPCTLDTCIPQAGCVSLAAPDGTPCPDANLCNGPEVCSASRCVATNRSPSCLDDANPCTRDLCDPLWGCLHPAFPIGTSCADANACNGTETCNSSGVCLPGTPIVCPAATTCNPILGICQ